MADMTEPNNPPKIQRDRRRLYETAGPAITAEAVQIAHEPTPEQIRHVEVDGVIHTHVLWSTAAGVVPIPFVDGLLVAGVQMRMLKELTGLYGLEFSEDFVKPVLASLSSGLFVNAMSRGPVGAIVRSIPVVGPLAGFFAMSALAGAATYAVGKVFFQHYESGGTLFTFDPDRVKAHFQEEYEKGKVVVIKNRERGNPNKPRPGPARPVVDIG